METLVVELARARDVAGRVRAEDASDVNAEFDDDDVLCDLSCALSRIRGV